METSNQDLKRAKITGLHPKSVVMLPKTCIACKRGNPCAKLCALISYKCSFCNHTNRRPNHFWLHVKRIHQMVKCKWCKLFGQIDEIEPHEGRCGIAKKSKVVDCHQCGKSFARKSVLKKHQESCLQNANLKCSLCKKIYHQKYAYHEHIKICSAKPQDIGRKYNHRKKTVPCQICDKLFVDTKAKSQHMFLQHNERDTSENKDFACIVCGKTFSNGSKLKAHITVVHKLEDARSFRKMCIETEYGNVQEERTSDSVCCLECFDTFPSVKKLKNHFKQVHNKTAVSTYCLICGQHVVLNQDCHGDECYDVLQCFHCEKKFFKFKDFIVHSLESHPRLPIKFMGIENGIKSRPLGLPDYIAAGSRLVRYNRNENAKEKYPFSVTYMESKKKMVMFGKTFTKICLSKVCTPDETIKEHVKTNEGPVGTPCAMCSKKVEQNKKIEDFLTKKEFEMESKTSTALFVTGKSLYPLL